MIFPVLNKLNLVLISRVTNKNAKKPSSESRMWHKDKNRGK